MAKKKSTSKRKSKLQTSPSNVLPQNILPIGERVEEDKNIYISQQVYKEIHKFTRNKVTNESGGVLIGSTIEVFGKTNILVDGFIEAKHCEATPTTLKFTHDSWEYIHREMDKKFSGKKILGWIHTHPDFGIFLSEYDKFIHENFFNESNQIAYVIDPIQNIEGFYFWINRKIEKCKGFYIYDSMGAKIDINLDKEEVSSNIEDARIFSFRNILLAALSVAVVFLIFSNISMKSEITRLQAQQNTIVTSANQSLAYLQQQILALEAKLSVYQETAEPVVGEDTSDAIQNSLEETDTLAPTGTEVADGPN